MSIIIYELLSFFFLRYSFISIYPYVDHDIKKMSCVLSLISSSIVSILSLVHLMFYSDVWMSEFVCSFLMVYFLTDLYLGSTFYPSRLKLLEGHIHHLSYAYIMFYLIITRNTGVILKVSILELPTVFLSLFPFIKSKYIRKAFGVSFFVLRLIYNAYIIPYFLFTQDNFIRTIPIFTLLMHSYWFMKWCKII